MRWAEALFSGNRKLLYFLAGLTISLLLLGLGLNQKEFISRIVQTIFYSPFFEATNKITQLLDVYDVNVELQSEIVRLNLERNQYLENKLENEQYRRMLHLLPRQQYRLLPAEVVAYNQGRRLSAVTIEANEPLSRFLSVVDEDGLVGKISSVTDNVASVSLLVGLNCRVAVRAQRTRSLGIVKWSAGEGLYLDHVSPENEITLGDTLISSGLGGVFPEGIAVGTVTRVNTDPTRFFKEIAVAPVVDFGSLDNVVVLMPAEQGGD